VLELVDGPKPNGPAAGEVLVSVEYAPVNTNDLYVIQGAFPVRPSLPRIVGNEGVGRVLAVGSGVEHLKVDDRILIPLYAFSWRERLVLPAAGLFSLPDADPQHFQAYRKQRGLTAIRTLNEAPHPILPQIARESYRPRIKSSDASIAALAIRIADASSPGCSAR
jgi:NADPH:quinone reductase-like Zn-dependent oxidoreductase